MIVPCPLERVYPGPARDACRLQESPCQESGSVEGAAFTGPNAHVLEARDMRTKASRGARGVRSHLPERSLKDRTTCVD